jgi:hypothetical protein
MAIWPVLSIEGLLIAIGITCYVVWGIYALCTHPDWIVVPPRGWVGALGEGLFAGEVGCLISGVSLFLMFVLTLAWVLIAPLILLVLLPFSTVLDRRAEKRRVAVRDRELEAPDYLSNEEDSESRWRR